MNSLPVIAIIGAGNGGQAYAGYLAAKGFPVRLYARNHDVANWLNNHQEINLFGAINTKGKIEFASSSIEETIDGADIILIATTASAHYELALKMCPYLKDNQVILLNPGRTFGAIEFFNTLKQNGCNKKIYVAEAQTLVFACRLLSPGNVHIIGIKDKVYVSAYPSSFTEYVISEIRPLFSCFYPAESILHTGLENIGAIFHPCVVLFNAATIERGEDFYFYRDMTPKIASFIEKFDQERLNIGNAFGIDLIGVSDWISVAYPETIGENLCEKMKNNPAYYDIKSPSSIYTRQLTEDIPTGILPMYELGRVAGIEMPLFKSMIEFTSQMLDIDFKEHGRTLKKLGLEDLSKEQIIDFLK